MTDVSAVTVRPPYLCPSEGHKHGVSIQSSIHLGDTLLQIMRRFLAMLLIYQSFMVSQILDLIHWTVIIFSFDHMTSENQEYTKQSSKKHLHRRKSYNSVLTCNPGLALTTFRTILLCFQQVNQTWACDPMENQHLVSGQLQKNTWPQWAINLNLRSGHVIRVSGHLVLTGVNWS